MRRRWFRFSVLPVVDEMPMPKNDIVIAKSLTAGMRRLLVAAFVHQKEASLESAGIDTLNEAFRREVGRLAVRGEKDDGEDVELTAAVRNGLLLFVDAAYREASERHAAPAQKH